jgi:uncharacterized protein YbaR (Trm112 family)
LDEELLHLLCCPLTRQPLHLANEDNLRDASAKVAQPILEGLIREDGRMLYPISNGIPLLTPEEGIPL